MPIYTVKFTRRVLCYDYVEREIEAGSLGEAETLADAMANDYDMDCPDDATSDGTEVCEEWGAETIEQV